MDTMMQNTLFFFDRHQAAYLAEAATALDVPLETVFQGNLDKLWQRFSNGFDTGASVNRKEDDL